MDKFEKISFNLRIKYKPIIFAYMKTDRLAWLKKPYIKNSEIARMIYPSKESKSAASLFSNKLLSRNIPNSCKKNYKFNDEELSKIEQCRLEIVRSLLSKTDSPELIVGLLNEKLC